MKNKSAKFSSFMIIFLMSFFVISKFNSAHAGLIEDIIKKEKLDPENKEGDQCKLMEKLWEIIYNDKEEKEKRKKKDLLGDILNYKNEFYYQSLELCDPRTYSENQRDLKFESCYPEYGQFFYIIYNKNKSPIGISELKNIFETKTNNEGYLVDSEFDNHKFMTFVYFKTFPFKKTSFIQFKDCKVIKIKNLNN